MSEKKEKATASQKLDGFLSKNKKVVIGIFIALVVAMIVIICCGVISSTSKEKNLAAVEAISYNLVEETEELEEAELTASVEKAVEALAKYNTKGGIVGVRANMLSAELYVLLDNNEKAIECYDAAAKKGKKAYTAPIANFNKAACYEKLNQTENACEAYKAATEAADFILAARANFNYGRVLESMGKYSEAVAAYEAVNNEASSWNNLAKTRIITLKAEGKVE